MKEKGNLQSVSSVDKKANDKPTPSRGPEPRAASTGGAYIIRKLERWRLRGTGVLKK